VNAAHSEFFDLRRIVRHELDRLDAEDPQDARCARVAPEVGREPEGAVRIDRVESVVLKVVRGDLVRDSDPAPFLSEVEQGSLPGTPDLRQRRIELFPAVAPLRPEHVPRHALRVDANEDIGLAGDSPFDERDVFFAIDRADEGVDSEVPVSRRQSGLASEEDVVAQQLAFEDHRRLLTIRRYIRIQV